MHFVDGRRAGSPPFSGPGRVEFSLIERRLSCERAPVQTFGINATRRRGTLRGSRGENSIPNFRRSFAVDAKLADFGLTFPDPAHQFSVGDSN